MMEHIIIFLITKRSRKDGNILCLGMKIGPVGTDNSIYGIAKIDSKWVIVFNSDLGQKMRMVIKLFIMRLVLECGKVFEKK